MDSVHFTIKLHDRIAQFEASICYYLRISTKEKLRFEDVMRKGCYCYMAKLEIYLWVTHDYHKDDNESDVDNDNENGIVGYEYIY